MNPGSMWLLAGFAAWHYAVALALGLLSMLIGWTFTARCRYHSMLERAAFSGGLGLGALAYVVFALGLIGWLSPGPILGALIILIVACRAQWRRVWSPAVDIFRRLGSRGWTVVPAGVFVLLPFLLLPLYPPTHWDATMYHLAVAKRYAAAHRIGFFPDTRFVLFPQLNEMLFSLALVLTDDITAQLLQTLMAALLAIALWAWGRRAESGRAGAWAAALLLANPIIIWLGSSAYIDVGVTLLGVLACYAYWNWVQTDHAEWSVLSGVFCGLAAASKYSALFWLCLLGVLITVRLVHRRQSGAVLAGFLLGALAGAPWYLRNAYYSGNPIFPFYPQVFGPGYWTLEDIRAMLLDLGHSYGVGQTASALAALPWYLAFNQDLFHSERHITAAYLFLLPVVAAAAALSRPVRWVGALAAGYTLWWFFTSQELRYLVPALPFYSLASAIALDRLAQRLPLPRRPLHRYGAAVLVAAALLLPGWTYVANRVRAQGPVPVTAAERDAFLTRALPSYPAYRFLNARHGRHYTVYAVYNENMAYFADGTFEGDWFGPDRYSRVLSRIGSSRGLYAELRALGAGYLLISDWRRVSLPVDRFFYDHFRPVFTAGSTWLFELVPPAATPPVPRHARPGEPAGASTPRPAPRSPSDGRRMHGG